MFALDCLVVAYGWFSGRYTYGRILGLTLVPLQFALAIELAAPRTWGWRRGALAGAAALGACVGFLQIQAGAVVPRALDPIGFDQPPRWPSYGWAVGHMRHGDVVLTDGYRPTRSVPGYGANLVAPAWPDASLDEGRQAAAPLRGGRNGARGDRARRRGARTAAPHGGARRAARGPPRPALRDPGGESLGPARPRRAGRRGGREAAPGPSRPYGQERGGALTDPVALLEDCADRDNCDGFDDLDDLDDLDDKMDKATMTWLITGGAGYIGAHVVRAMAEAGERAVVYDDLSTGVAGRVPEGIPLVVGSVLDGELLARTLAEHAVTGVVHLAGKKRVAESVERPLHYYHENVEGLRVLLDAAVSPSSDVRHFVFSSSASVYGMPDVDLVTEETPCLPMSPYGETKLAGEWLVRAAGRAHGLATASLRYFNVAGAASPELADTGVFNLVPMVFEKLTAGEAPRIFGADYATPDGTCVRDYIHVADVAEAHVATARALASAEPGTDLTLNIGRGKGCRSVR
ncbi:ADP-L-glycero-D-manno-heptose-6-epimerase [Streptomyces alboniger]